MPDIKAFQVTTNSGQMPLSARQRMLAAEMLQDQAATKTVTPAGKRGLAVGMAQLLAGGLGGYVEGQAIRQYEAGSQAVRDARARMIEHMPGMAAGATGGASISPANGTSGAIQGAGSSSNAATAYQYYRNKGLPDASARALVGGFQQESGPGLNTGALAKGDGADGSNSVGIGQWNGDRAAALRQFAAANGRNPGDLQTQLDFSWQELNGPEKASLNQLMAANDDRSATAAAIGYERPAGWSADNPAAAISFGKRLANTTALAGLSSGQSPAAPSDVTAAADLPASNAHPAMADGLPGDMQGGSGAPPIPMLSDYMDPGSKTISPENMARYEAARTAAENYVASIPDPSQPSPGGTGAAPQDPGQIASPGASTTPPAIPGSAFSPSADLSGGVIDANVATSPGSSPSSLTAQQRSMLATMLQSDPGTPDLTAANPNGDPGAMLQPSDMLNNAPAPSQGLPGDGSVRDTIQQAWDAQKAPGLDAAMAQPMPPRIHGASLDPTIQGVAAAQQAGNPSLTGAPSPYGIIPPGTGDVAAQSLPTALAPFPMQDTPAGTMTPNSGTPLPDPTQPSFQAGTTVGAVPMSVNDASNTIMDAQAAGMPSFTALPDTNGNRVALSNSPDMGGGNPMAQLLAGGDVPLPPKRPPQALIDMLAQGGPSDGSATPANPSTATAQAQDVQVTTNRGPSSVDPSPTGSIGGQVSTSPTPPPDLPAPNAVPAMGQGLPGDITAGGPGGGFAPIGKNAGFQTPTDFNLQQGGADMTPGQRMAALLANWTPGQTSSAPSMTPAQRTAMVNLLQQGTGSGSAFRTVMDGGDIDQVARQQDAQLNGGQGGPGQPTPQALAYASILDPNVARQQPAASGGAAPGGYDRAAMMQDADAILRSPYATPEDRQAAMSMIMPSYSIKDLPDGTTLRINNMTGEATPIYHGQVKHYGATKDGQIYDEFTGGGVNGQPLGAAFRLMTPEEKQAAGLPIDQPFQVGPNGKISGTTGQTINIGGAQSEYEKSMSEAVAKRHVGLMEGVEGAQERSRALNEMSDAVQRIRAAGGTTGMGQSDVMRAQSAINSAANVLGFQPFDISDKEVVAKLNKQIAASAAKSLSTRGATNFDFSQMQAANPGLDMSPTANQRLIGLAQQAEQRNVELGQQIRTYAAQQQAQGRKADPAAVETMITNYDAGHHFRDPITGQDLTANPRLPEFQGQGSAGGSGAPQGGSAGPGAAGGAPGGTGAAPPLSPVQQQAASSTSQAQALASARAAIAAGKSRTAVMQRLQQLGINPGAL